MSGRVLVERLAVERFRNIEQLAFSPAPRLNLLAGDNGHGKTSLIEALYVLCTTRSFRSSRLADTVQDGATKARVQGRMQSLELSRIQEATISPRGRSFLIDGKRAKRSVDYATSTPMIAFHPGDLELVAGPATSRRILLDRVALYLDPQGAAARTSYTKAVKERQALLATSGPHARELDAYEPVIARHGILFARGRRRAAERLAQALVPAFEQMAAPGLRPRVSYEPGGTEDSDVFEQELRDRRLRDQLRGAATYGPQRDELTLRLDERLARSHASQGQQRLLTLALKLAELDCVRSATALEPVLLLDDVSSELDGDRTDAVFSLLRRSSSQIFVTTTRPELFSSVKMSEGERADFCIVSGRLEQQAVTRS